VTPAPPPLTIGLPVFNGERFIADAVSSILAQDFTDFALVISDNASTDGTEELCREWAAGDARVTYVRHDTNRGAAWNANYLVTTTRGPFFKWAAHDDVLRPTALKRCLEALAEHPEVVLSFTRRVKIDEDGKVIKPPGERSLGFTSIDSRPHERLAAWLRLQRACIEFFGVIRRPVLEQTRLHGSYLVADRVLLAELALRGPFHEVPEALFLHRDHPGRSVYQPRADGSLARWFDPSNTGRISFPTWRLVFEYSRAIADAPIGLDERRRCYAVLGRWAARRWWRLADNIVDASVGLVRRPPQRTRG
jgi:glycosyltransferase involved in cell wall biosynthesis